MPWERQPSGNVVVHYSDAERRAVPGTTRLWDYRAPGTPTATTVRRRHVPITVRRGSTPGFRNTARTLPNVCIRRHTLGHEESSVQRRSPPSSGTHTVSSRTDRNGRRSGTSFRGVAGTARQPQTGPAPGAHFYGPAPPSTTVPALQTRSCPGGPGRGRGSEPQRVRWSRRPRGWPAQGHSRALPRQRHSFGTVAGVRAQDLFEAGEVT